MTKKFLSIVLSFVVVLCVMPIVAGAAENDVFTIESAEGISVTYKVLTEKGTTGTVQVGDGKDQAVSASVSSLTLSDTVTNSGITYTVTNIGKMAFYDCTNLSLTFLPSGLKSIGTMAFSGCTSLELTSLPDGVTYIGDYAFSSCRNLSLTYLPSVMTDIGNDVFYGCKDLSLTSLPSGLTNIGKDAFYGCKDLSLTSLPSGVKIIGDSAFYGCTDLSLTSLPSGVKIIGDSAFYNCSKIVLTSLPSGLTSIGNAVFSGCTSLKLTSLPSGVTSIGNAAFFGCVFLKLTSLPSGVTSIGNAAFYGCAFLKLTSLPSGLTNIGNDVFYGCTDLSLTSLPSGVTSIVSNAFGNCTNLVLTSLPSGATSIGDGAFAGCTSLALTSLPDSVTTIGNSAFLDCTNISSISCGSMIAPTLGKDSYGNVAAEGTLYVPFGATGYIVENGWPWPATQRANLSGTVYDLDGITPSAGASVTLNGKSVIADDSGKFLFTAALGNGEHTISATDGISYSSIDIMVSDANLDNVDITLKALSEPILSGDTELTITEGYSDASTGTYTVDGNPLPVVTKVSGDDKITWNDSTRKLDIAAGLTAGSYPVKLTAVNSSGNSELTFTLVVEAKSISVNISQSTGGKISVSDEFAEIGDIVTVTATPDNGYILKNIFVNGTAITGNTFVMNDINSTVTAEFEKTTVTAEFEKTTTPVETRKDASVPQTSDGSNMVLWVALLFISGGAFISLTVCMDRKKNKAK